MSLVSTHLKMPECVPGLSQHAAPVSVRRKHDIRVEAVAGCTQQDTLRYISLSVF